MTIQQEIAETKERLKALRAQVQEEQMARVSAASESADQARLDALSAEEKHLQEQLAEIQATAMPGGPSAVPVPPVESAPAPSEPPAQPAG